MAVLKKQQNQHILLERLERIRSIFIDYTKNIQKEAIFILNLSLTTTYRTMTALKFGLIFL